MTTCLIRTIGTLGKGIKVGNIMETTTIGMGIETGVGSKMDIGRGKMIIKIK